ncbi:MAG: hemerythrin family protein [Anaeromyxobacter sp.]
MAVTWNERLAIGEPEIDAQHRELFERVDALLVAMRTGAGRERLEEMFGFLQRYVLEHFQAEEALMRAEAYPHLAEHRDQHEAFIVRIVGIEEQLREHGPCSSYVMNASALLCEWPREHVADADRHFGQHLALRRRRAESAPA